MLILSPLIRPAQTTDSFEVIGEETWMPRALAVGYYQALAFVHADCRDRDAEHVGRFPDRVQSVTCL